MACSSQQKSSTSEPSVFGGTEKSDSLFMTFERTPCFGKCPAFRVMLYRSGYATYEGTQFSEHMGMHSGFMTVDEMDEILEEAERIDFFSLEETYDAQVTDLPSMIIEIKTTAKSHKTRARVGTPAALKEFGKYLDNKVNAVVWTAFGPEE